MADPLPQALILTAIVITFGVSAFVLAMIHRSWRLVHQEVVGTDEEDRRVAARSATDADELDPDELDPADRAAGHADSLHTPEGDDLGADDVDLPAGTGAR
jgi:multicomponent Na+:H+ antiporter subunit C